MRRYRPIRAKHASRHTFKLLPGRPSMTFLTSSVFFLGGILRLTERGNEVEKCLGTGVDTLVDRGVLGCAR